MDIIHSLYNHNLVKSIIKDNPIDENGDVRFTNKYIDNTRFSTLQFLDLLQQLENAVELLSSFTYNKNSKVNRGDFLHYNIENYIIRLNSIIDRLLQIVNDVFDFKINVRGVSLKTIKLKIENTAISNYIDNLDKLIYPYSVIRNRVIHQNSYSDDETLRNIKLFYYSELFNDEELLLKVKRRRVEILKEFIQKKKEEYRTINKQCVEIIMKIFDELEIEYDLQKNNFR